jgi:signal transduction histidine kinase
MRKVALVFVLAVLLPSLVLAWLAVRSLRDQQFVLERQQSLLYQGVTDALAHTAESMVLERQREFGQQIESMLARSAARDLAASFDARLRDAWPFAKVGFVVTTGGEILSPPLNSRTEAQQFRQANAPFLGNRESAEVYFNKSQVLNTAPAAVAQGDASLRSSAQQARAPAAKAMSESESSANYVQLKQPQTRNIYPQKADLSKNSYDNTVQQQEFSKAAPAEAEFKQLIGDAQEGTLARFVNNELNVLVWYRSPRDARFIFGAQLDLTRLTRELQMQLRLPDRGMHSEICVAVLDDGARPVAVSHPEFRAQWKHPFVATEIGDTLPHWEAAAYLLNPARLTESARTLKLTLGLLIATLVFAIGVGSWLIVADLNRQLRLARQKTDFVSNVSHELKTPLTSIRMFSELLAEGRVTDPAKQRSYFNIITAETARLTRLINNVLDFARLERGEKKYNFAACDLVALAQASLESYRPHLENNGFKLEVVISASSLMVRGDRDALAQVVLNLLSNAEKYSNGRREILVEVNRREGPLPHAELSVSDRGPGVPHGCEEKIFEKFYRAHDALSSGIQGSGLGLTLARQIARAHGGDVAYESRADGGSRFSLRLPLQPEALNPSLS